MRRFLISTCIGLLLPFLLACEKEDVKPNDPTVTQTKPAATASCPNYRYLQKRGGVVNYGQPRGDLVLVGFLEGMSQGSRGQVLS
ncbi:hypothetical protein [Rufibacter radiotolerans]|uniref:hypothetical protein n=1 Tax=Rufibacter radiotolerans TaxID=1379910 RepID=UPI000A672668|nr:hypothetical protein [Rufibacter radiotolerans]